MAITISSSHDDALSLEAYMQFVHENIVSGDTDCLIETAWALKALANNHHFLLGEVNDEIKRLAGRDNLMKTYTPQSLLLASEGEFIVRANLWLSPSKIPTEWDLERRIFSYLTAHDHNFDFVTVGYMGAGYTTDIYEYEPEAICGDAGEKVDLRFLERTTLPPGKLMVYRRSRDVHVQYPPLEFSVSLNLLVVRKDDLSLTPQYFFDLEHSQILRISESCQTSQRMTLLKFAAEIGDDNTLDILDSIAARHQCGRTREHAKLAAKRLQARAPEHPFDRTGGESDAIS